MKKVSTKKESEHEKFLKEYVLNRAKAAHHTLDGNYIGCEAERAWKKIQEALKSDK